jgi:hypothetical protein
MKKLLFAFILIIVCFVSNAQQIDSIQYVTNTNAEKLIDKYSEKMTNAITVLAEKLKQPAEHVYGILVKQSLVQGWSIFVAFIIATILFVIVFIGAIKNWANAEETFGFLSIILGVCWLIAIVILISDGLPRLLNPEYEAIQQILKLL